MQSDLADIPDLPDWVPYEVKRHLIPGDTIPDKNALGKAWIHGLEPREEDLFLPLHTLPGHVLIVGTTRSGKTRLYQMLTFGVVHMGAALIVVDPKGDRDLAESLEAECKRAGRPFLYFHPAFPSKSIRINPCKSWTDISEVASRLSELLADSGDFAKFAHLFMDRVNRGLIYLGERPTIAKIYHYINRGVEELLERCLSRFMTANVGANWESKLASYGKAGRLESMVTMYTEMFASKGAGVEAIEGLVGTFTHAKDHYTKIIANLLPLLQTLATGEVGALLSPDALDLADTRPIYDMEQIVRGNYCLYVGLNSLANKTVGSNIGSIILAEMASVAGAIYNYYGSADCYVFLDEDAEIVNDQQIALLNKGGGAGFKAFIATQTLADFEARLGSRSKALQNLGNTNTIISLRVKDLETARYVSEAMYETVVRSMDVSYTSGTETEATAVEFRGTVSRKVNREKVPLVPPDLLTSLPNLQYFAVIAGGVVKKGRLGIITNG